MWMTPWHEEQKRQCAQVIIFNKAAFNWQRNKRMEWWYYCSLHYDECFLSLPNNAYAYFALFLICAKIQSKKAMQVIIFNKAAFNWQINKRKEWWYYCSLFSPCLTMHMLTLHFSQAVQKFSPKNVSQYPPKSHTMNTTSLTLILVSMLVANATASLTFGQNWILNNPTPLKPIIIQCEGGTIAITMTGNDDQGWKLNVGATNDCNVLAQEFGTRKATGEKIKA